MKTNETTRILYALLVVISAVAVVFGCGDKTCKSIREKLDFDEIRHQGKWIVYGGNLQCDNCCITYDMILRKPGYFTVRNVNFTSSGNKTLDIPTSVISPGYYQLGPEVEVYVLGTNYATYLVAYTQPGIFAVYVRNLDVLKDKCTRKQIMEAFNEHSRICGTNYKPYNIEKACKKYNNYLLN